MSVVRSYLEPGPGVTALMAWQISGGESLWRESWQLVEEAARPSFRSNTLSITRLEPDGSVKVDHVLHLVAPPHGISISWGSLSRNDDPLCVALDVTHSGMNGLDPVVCMRCLASLVPPAAWWRRNVKGTPPDACA